MGLERPYQLLHPIERTQKLKLFVPVGLAVRFEEP